jgi:hypothetical protein
MGAIGAASAGPKVVIKAKNIVKAAPPVTGKPPGKTLFVAN